jgi:hypothetical protein
MPGIFEQLKGLLQDRYAAGPPKGYPSAGPGSVLDNKNMQLQQLMPNPQPLLSPQQSLPMKPQPQMPAPDPTAAYGTRPGEKRIDVSEYQRPLSGFSGVKTQ